MRIFPKTSTLAKIVFGTYLLIWIVPVAINVGIQLSLDEHVEMTRSAQENFPPELKTAIESMIEHSSMYSAARQVRQLLGTFQGEAGMVEYLLDLQTLLIIILMTTFSLGAIMVWALIVRIDSGINKTNRAITNLAHGKLSEPIRFEGTENISSVGMQLEELRQRLLETERQQTHFLRHISHEIKTPLTSIKEGTQLLADELIGPITAEQKEITDILRSSTGELQSSIESLLNYNSALSVKQIKQREIVNLAELINEVLEKHALQIKTKSLNIISNRQNHRAFVDREQIKTVFDNLISNAIKYSPEKGRIWLRLDHIGKDVIFTIKDQGVGIKKEHRTAVFDAFYVGQNDSGGPLKGTGLGLSIARQYVEAHQGTIKALESPRGAMFEVTLRG